MVHTVLHTEVLQSSADEIDDMLWEAGKYADVILPTLVPDSILYKERFS
jgi:hypothetical protein